ncbi:MAG: phosphodiester glycosidase family protein [Chloroflexota bacterium]
MNNYLLLVDTYEAETIDEHALVASGVAGQIIRLNHIEGGHHLDETFTTQWVETGLAGLVRIPYFVYNPWVNGETNYEWLVKHMPLEAGAVMVDVEVKKFGYSPSKYASELRIFCDLAKLKWNVMIYTGEGFTDLLSEWPTDLPYWWAQYPFSMYPSHAENRTWNQVRATIDGLPGPSNVDKVPGGNWKMWQASGDRLILPGSAKPIDVNVFPGTLAELKAWANEKDVVDPNPFIEEHTEPFAGVKFHKVYRYHSHCYVAEIDPAGKTFLVTKFGHKKVSTVARELGAQIVINGGAYRGYSAVGLHASQGTEFVGVSEYEPWINLTEDHRPQINPHNSKAKRYNALAGKRYIVKSGAISPNTSNAWREVHPRTLVGVTQDGKLIECVVDGRQGPKNIGVNLFDAARIMIEFGAWEAIDLDGGGSSAMWVHDRIVNSPIEDGVPGQERLVGDHLVMWVGGIVLPPSNDYMVVKPVKPRRTPSMYETDTKLNLPVGTTFESDVTQVVTEVIPEVNGTEYTIAWVQMPDGYWVPKFYKFEYVKNLLG